VQSPGNRALLFVRGRCVMALGFVSFLLGEKNPHKNIGTVGPLSIQGEGGGEGPRTHGVTVGSGRDGLAGLALRVAHSLRSRSVQLAVASCRTLGRGVSSLPQACYMRKKSPHFHAGSHLKYSSEGGMDSLRSPCGQPTHCVHGLSNWLSPVVEPSVEGAHSSRRRATCEKKARIFMRALL